MSALDNLIQWLGQEGRFIATIFVLAIYVAGAVWIGRKRVARWLA